MEHAFLSHPARPSWRSTRRWSPLSAVVALTFAAFGSWAQTLPTLQIERGVNSDAVLSWAPANGFIRLEEADTLMPGALWRGIPSQPLLSEGRLSTRITLNAGNARFFRLRVLTPPSDATVASLLGEATEFLYTGDEPIQTGVEKGVIERKRASVICGKVKDREGSPLPGVTVSILNHPEFGRTLSRADGRFDLAANGGGRLTLNYDKAGYCPVQRQVDAPWQDWAPVPDVVMVSMDAKVTTVVLGANSGLQVHEASLQTDRDGSRRATVMVPSGTTAQIVLPDGSVQPLSSLSLRATEFTVGTSGPAAMPADLPATSGYTYCVELSADEAMTAGAVDVRFSVPLPVFVENFLGFPVGSPVPLGSYDRVRGMWVPAESGRVIRLLGVTQGLADLDLNGDGEVDTGSELAALSITDPERQRLATLYTPGQTLWRLPIPHFTPWDANWSLMPPPDAEPPEEDPSLARPEDQCCRGSGSIIEIENQILGEAVLVSGTPYTLNYQSERVPGRKEAYSVEIPLSGLKIPASLRRIELEVSVAGQFSQQSFPPLINQNTRFVWDGRNAYGQLLQGMQPITIRIGYTYRFVYGTTSRFGDFGGEAISASPSREEVTLWRTFRGKIGTWNARGIGLGGWSLSPHHVYDPTEQILYRGDGERQSARAMGPTIQPFAGRAGFNPSDSGDGGPATNALVAPQGLAVAADGSLYIASPAQGVIRRVSPDGIIHTVAGNDQSCPGCGDGGPAMEAGLGSPWSVAVAPDGTFYIGEARAGRQVIRKVSPDGIISTFAGTGVHGASGDGGPAILAQIGTAFSLAVGPDGAVYMADATNRRIRRITPDGIISTIAGTGVAGFSGDGGPAIQARLGEPTGVAVGPDGSVFIADAANHRVRRVTPDGIIRTIAGDGVIGFGGDGLPATQGHFRFPTAIAIGPDETVFIVDQGNFRVRWMRLGGTLQTLAGQDFPGTRGDFGPASRASLQDLQGGLTVGPEGSVYVSQTGSSLRVRRILPLVELLQGGAAGEIMVPATDGGEVYVFTLNGRHLRTLESLTGTLIHQFSYDEAGRLTGVVDVYGNETRIERDREGNPTAIVGPYGQRTGLALDGEGYLSQITAPDGEAIRLSHTADGLLTRFITPRDHASSYAYDTLGRLVSATDPAGTTKTLTRSGRPEDFTVTLSRDQGQTSIHRVETQPNGDRRVTVTSCDGTSSQSTIGTEGRLTASLPDGSRAELLVGPDPRWGMRSPILAQLTTTAPGGQVSTVTSLTSVVLASPGEYLNVVSRTETLAVNGRPWTRIYDGTNRTITSISPLGRRTRMVLDEQARLSELQAGLLNPIRLGYDVRGRLSTRTVGEGANARQSAFEYRPEGFLAGQTDPLGQRTELLRDVVGRVTSQILPGGQRLRIAYEANGNIRALTPPGRPEHLFTYNQRDDLVAYTPPEIGAGPAETGFDYNADRNPIRIEDPDGSAMVLTYDENHCRLNSLTLSSHQKTYAHDVAGRISSLASGDGVVMEFSYDQAALTAVAWRGPVAGSVNRAHDIDSRITSLRVNGADPVNFQYDADDSPVQVGALTLERNAETGFIDGSNVGAVTRRLTYDSFGAPASFRASYQGVGLYELALVRDGIGRIARKVERIGETVSTFDYHYDPSGRLTEVLRDGGALAAYRYDENGNRVSRSDVEGVTSGVYDAQDRALQFGPRIYAHNRNGERISMAVAGQTTTYRYTGSHALKEVALPDGSRIDYLIDGLDRRIGKRVNGVLTQGFLYQDLLRPIAELDGAGAVVTRFVYATRVNVPDYFIKGGVTYALITDHLGSPRLVIDVATGLIAQRMEHDEFGRVLLDTNPGFQPFGFAGGLFDPHTGLVHFGAREFDPETGRWTTKDPIGFAGGDANLYAYVLNDPINNIDPLGLYFPSDKYAALLSPQFAAVVGYAVTRGQQTIRGIGAFGARVGQGLANLGRTAQNFFCPGRSGSTLPGAPTIPNAASPFADTVLLQQGAQTVSTLAPQATQVAQAVQTAAPQAASEFAGLSWALQTINATRGYWEPLLDTDPERARRFQDEIIRFGNLLFGL